MNKPIEALIAPKSKNDFLQDYKATKSFVVHGLKDSTAELIQLPFLQSIEEMLKFWNEKVSIHLPEAADEATALEVSSDEVMPFFNDGMGVRFDDVNRFSELLASWTESLREELGLSKMTFGRSLVYVTPAGKGNALHFDQNINFVLQVTGTKKWWVAPNRTVENPMTRHVIGQPTDPELDSYTTNEMPEKLPENAELYVLKPGSLLFVPRGAWHQTEAETDALSLNFTFSPPTWLDLLGAAMRGRLAMSPEWRETAELADPSIAIERFDSLIAELAADVATWRANDILGATEG